MIINILNEPDDVVTRAIYCLDVPPRPSQQQGRKNNKLSER